MKIQRLVSLAALLVAGASASVSSFAAGPLGNELTDMPKAQSTRSRADVVAETRAAMKAGTLERSSYDELVGVIADRSAAAHATAMASRSDVKADTRAAMAGGKLERTSYDEQIGVVTDRQRHQ